MENLLTNQNITENGQNLTKIIQKKCFFAFFESNWSSFCPGKCQIIGSAKRKYIYTQKHVKKTVKLKE